MLLSKDYRSKKIETGIVFFLCCFAFLAQSFAQVSDTLYGEIWNIDNTSRIGDTTLTILGEPIVIQSDVGPAVEFDGVNDGLIVDKNPLSGADEFTVEVIFKPYEGPMPANTEQRFIHVQESDDKRLLIELRLTDDNHWFLDTFIKDGASNKTLYAESYPHEIGKWYHAALVYKDGNMRHYVNGIEELSGEVSYSAMQAGQTSIGVRINKKSWFNGAISKLKVTHKALIPDEFLGNPTTVGVTDHNSHNKMVDAFSLYQNYPNPFNPKTTIRYQLRKAAQVNLSIFNTAGKLINKLIQEYQSAGTHKKEWNPDNNADNIAGGLYYVTLQSDQITKSIKIIYLP